MTQIHPSDPTQDVELPGLVKPSIHFEKITFSNGAAFEFSDDEIIVFVGPNNSGKSAILRELEQYFSKSSGEFVLKSAQIKKYGSAEDFQKYLDAHASKVGNGTNLSYGGLGYNIHHTHVPFFDRKTDQHIISPFFCMRIGTESRIVGGNSAEPIALFQTPPTHPIHRLLMDNQLADEVSGMFRHAFGKDLFVFRAGGARFPLLVGEKPKLNDGEDELSRTFIDRAFQSSIFLEAQGDGMRSFASILLFTLIHDHHSILLLDEPEAFLHPPQARLVGEFIARNRKSKSQLFIATHSDDILSGLIQGGGGKVRIFRIQREGQINRVKELSREKTAKIVNDTLVRYSGVLAAIFYEHVVICESDADCLFYSSILNTRAVTGDRRADVQFIHAAGKHRIAQLAGTLRDLDVPTSVIVDIDILREEATFRNLVETLGGSWTEFSSHFFAIKQSIEERRPSLNSDQVVSAIQEQLKQVSGTGDFPKSAEAQIKQIFKRMSSWDEVKRAGRSAISPGGATRHFDELNSKCAAIGLWIVPVGELEGFCRSIDGGHGPGFVSKVLEERNLEDHTELSEAREFVRAIWTKARSGSVA